MLARRAEPGGDQQGTKLVAVQPGGVRLIVQTGPSDIGGRGVIKELFFDGVAVEVGDGAQPSGDDGPGAAAGFQVTGEALDVGTARLEQPQVMLLAPGHILAQVQGVRLAGRCNRPGTQPGRAVPAR
jgi:hypothetical protein